MLWTDFKTLVDTWQIKNQVLFTPKNADGTYTRIWANFAGQTFTTDFLDPNDTGIAVFEASYKQTPSMVWVSGKDVLRGDVASQTPISASTTTNCDVQFTSNTWVFGGNLIVQGTSVIDGDGCEVQVVDKDGVYAPAGTVLRSIINQKFLPSERVISVDPLPGEPPSLVLAGLYLRFVYTEVSGISGKIADINIVAMK